MMSETYRRRAERDGFDRVLRFVTPVILLVPVLFIVGFVFSAATVDREARQVDLREMQSEAAVWEAQLMQNEREITRRITLDGDK
jgi:hypothetical protein